MNSFLFKPVLFGALFGVLAFFTPFFLFKLFFIFLIFGLFFGYIFRGSRYFNGWRDNPAAEWAFANNIRNMNNEELAGTAIFSPSVYVFRTDVHTRRQAAMVCNNLKERGLARKATLDLEDCDRVLRVESLHGNRQKLVDTVSEMGVFIEVLD